MNEDDSAHFDPEEDPLNNICLSLKKINPGKLRRIQSRLKNKGLGYITDQELSVLVFNPIRLGEKRGNILLNDLEAYFKISQYEIHCPKYQ